MKKAIVVATLLFVACATTDRPQEPAAAQPEKRKPTKEEMCKDPKTSPELLRLLCE